jgi:origin recognition complex subunit 3
VYRGHHRGCWFKVYNQVTHHCTGRYSAVGHLVHWLDAVPIRGIYSYVRDFKWMQANSLPIFLPQLINPSPRASILAGLIHPQDYISPEQPSGDDDDDEELPDTSILFKGYLESGKMINVYDWFESFAVVLEARKRQLAKKHITDGKRGNSGTPSRKKGKQKQVEVDNEDAEGDEEEWHMEVQARFIRALQELDYLGFIKHTGRKVDHVMRIVFDSPE